MLALKLTITVISGLAIFGYLMYIQNKKQKAAEKTFQIIRECLNNKRSK